MRKVFAGLFSSIDGVVEAPAAAKVLEQARVEDHLVDNEDRPVAAVAQEVLRRAGWLDPGAGA